MFRFISRLLKQCCKYIMEFIHRISLCMYILIKGVDSMVDTYVVLISRKRRTIEQVPQHLREAVLADLSAMGLDGNGDPLPKEAPKKK